MNIFLCISYSKSNVPKYISKVLIKPINNHTYKLFCFIITIIIALLVSRLADKLISSISLGWLNSLLGGVFGGLKFAIIISVLMNVFDALDTKFHFARPESKTESIGYYPVLKLAPSLWDQSKEAYQKSKNAHQDEDKTTPENETN